MITRAEFTGGPFDGLVLCPAETPERVWIFNGPPCLLCVLTGRTADCEQVSMAHVRPELGDPPATTRAIYRRDVVSLDDRGPIVSYVPETAGTGPHTIAGRVTALARRWLAAKDR